METIDVQIKNIEEEVKLQVESMRAYLDKLHKKLKNQIKTIKKELQEYKIN
jgi:hypothetical protein